jgi:UDP-N-acetylmuramate--alanine ligase
MSDFDSITHVYFLGIGGIGMSALARYFNHTGCRVAGYDRTLSGLTKELEKEGIQVHYEDSGAEVRKLVSAPEKTLVVLTPAVPADHKEWNWLKENSYPVFKRSEVLGMICNRKKCIAVAGTHGKTTVSTMTAVILKSSRIGCGAFLGGISKNFDSNLILPDAGDEWLVTEADEYDRSFLRLTPDVAVITYMDADHLDIYGTREEMEESFLQFARQVRPGGCLIVNRDLVSAFRNIPGRKIITYSLYDNADFHAADLKLNAENSCYTFRLVTPSGITSEIEMIYPGILNVENAVAAAAAAWNAGADLNEIPKGLIQYTGVKRRFDIRYQDKSCLFIDDYAHHPRELEAFISSVRLLYPGKKITGIFQPHLYTRTRDFALEFAKSLDMLDTAILLPVYPARELPIEGVNPALIRQFMTSGNCILAEKSDIAGFIRDNRPEILLTIGAGDIELLSDEIISVLNNEKND